MEVVTLKCGAAVVAHKDQTWLLDAPKGVGAELDELGIVPTVVLLTRTVAPGIKDLSEGLKVVRQIPLRGDGLEAEAHQYPHGWDYVVRDDSGASLLFSQRGDVSGETVKGHDLAVIGNKYRANAFDESVLTRPWPAQSFFLSSKVYSSLSEAPDRLKEMDGAKLSLAQINAIVRQAEGIPEGEVDEPWAVAIANFKKAHHKEGDRWVANKEEETEKQIPTTCVCPNCGNRDAHKVGRPCNEQDCSECGTPMMADRRTATVSHAASRGVVAGLAGGVKAEEDGKSFEAALTILKGFYPEADPAKPGALSVFKDDGCWRWASITSATVWDKQDELVTRKAMDYALAYAHLTGQKGPLRHEHIPGLDCGECDWQMRKGGFLFESGFFYDNEFAQQCRKTYQGNPDYQISAGLRYRLGDIEDGVYKRMVIFERSPTKTPAVPLTALGVRKHMIQVTDEMLKQVADELQWPIEELRTMVDQTMKSDDPPGDLESLKSALVESQTNGAIEQLLTNLPEAHKAALFEKLAADREPAGSGVEPVTDGDTGQNEIAALKATVEGLVTQQAETNKAIMALAEALKGGGATTSVQEAMEQFLSDLPRQEAAQFLVDKSGGMGDGPTLQTMQAQLNEIAQKIDAGAAARPAGLNYEAFTSQRLNPNRGGG